VESVFGRLRLYNAVLGVVHLVQAGATLALSNDFSLPVTGSYLQAAPGQAPPGEPVVEFDLRVGPLVAVFLLLAAADHLLVSAPGLYDWYVRNLRRGVNYARWYEYSLSASLMIVLIAAITGIADIAALLAIFGANAAMILFGLVMERHNLTTERTDWTAFVFGSLVGIAPWVAIVVYVAGAEENAAGEGVPTFVYGIIASLFVLFFSFAVNMWLQYRKVGPWRDYLFGEKGYIVLSLVAKSALAWQMFANTLV